MIKKYLSLYPIISSFILGVVSVLGFAPFYIFPVSIISLSGLFLLWQQSTTAIRAARIGFSFGLGLFIAGIYWIYISLHIYGGMPWWMASVSTFLLCAFLALFPASVGYLSHRYRSFIFAMPVFWVLSEWIRGWIFTGFPWLVMGYSQVPYSPLVGYMPIVGVYGTGFIMALLAALLVFVITTNAVVTTRRSAMAAIFLIIVSGGILRFVPWVSPAGFPVAVALLQGNIAQDMKWSPEMASATIDRYVEMVKRSKAKLVVLPETALPVIQQNLGDENVRALQAHMRRNQGDVLLGVVELQQERYFNSMVSYGVSPSQVYRKSHLVPFGEFIPLKGLLGWIYRDWLHIPLADLSRGGQQSPMHVAGQKVAVNICYEDVFGEEIIQQLPEATLLVNASNDAWYGQSTASHQHLQISQARAIETGRMMLRATNTGATAIIDQNGFVIAHAPHDTFFTLNGFAQGFSGSTPYVRWGNWVIVTLLLMWFGYMELERRKPRR